MKTLANLRDKLEIEERLDRITLASPRQWGRMTVREMVCHLNDAFLVAMGDKTAEPIGNWASRTLIKQAALWGPMQWPHGVRTVPECDARLLGTPPADFEADLGEARRLLGRFAAQPRGYQLQDHAIFGVMSEKEWLRWGYLHTDHHLRQFAA